MKFQNLKFLYPRWSIATQSAVLHIILPFSLFLPGTVPFLRNLFCKEHFFGYYKQKMYIGLSLILKLLGTVFPRQKSTFYTKKRKILKSGLQVSENIPKHFRDNFQIFFNL